MRKLIRHKPVVLSKKKVISKSKSPYCSATTLCILPNPVYFWDTEYFHLLLSIRHTEKTLYPSKCRVSKKYSRDEAQNPSPSNRRDL